MGKNPLLNVASIHARYDLDKVDQFKPQYAFRVGAWIGDLQIRELMPSFIRHHLGRESLIMPTRIVVLRLKKPASIDFAFVNGQRAMATANLKQLIKCHSDTEDILELKHYVPNLFPLRTTTGHMRLALVLNCPGGLGLRLDSLNGEQAARIIFPANTRITMREPNP